VNILITYLIYFIATVTCEFNKSVPTHFLDMYTFFFSFKTLLLAVGYCCGLLNNTRPYNILVFLPTETKSHFMGFQPLLEKLVARGHNVTLVSPFALGSGGTALPHYTHVKVENTEKISSNLYIFIFYTYLLINYNKSIPTYKLTNIQEFCIRHLE